MRGWASKTKSEPAYTGKEGPHKWKEHPCKQEKSPHNWEKVGLNTEQRGENYCHSPVSGRSRLGCISSSRKQQLYRLTGGISGSRKQPLYRLTGDFSPCKWLFSNEVFGVLENLLCSTWSPYSLPPPCTQLGRLLPGQMELWINETFFRPRQKLNG